MARRSSKERFWREGGRGRAPKGCSGAVISPLSPRDGISHHRGARCQVYLRDGAPHPSSAGLKVVSRSISC